MGYDPGGMRVCREEGILRCGYSRTKWGGLWRELVERPYVPCFIGVSRDKKQGLTCCPHTAVRVGWKRQNANWRRSAGVRWRAPLRESGYPILFKHTRGIPLFVNLPKREIDQHGARKTACDTGNVLAHITRTVSEWYFNVGESVLSSRRWSKIPGYVIYTRVFIPGYVIHIRVCYLYPGMLYTPGDVIYTRVCYLYPGMLIEPVAGVTVFK